MSTNIDYVSHFIDYNIKLEILTLLKRFELTGADLLVLARSDELSDKKTYDNLINGYVDVALNFLNTSLISEIDCNIFGNDVLRYLNRDKNSRQMLAIDVIYEVLARKYKLNYIII